MHSPETEVALLWKEVQDLKKEDGRDKLSSVQRDAVRSFLWRFLVPTGVVASAIGFIGGAAYNAQKVETAIDGYRQQMGTWATDAALAAAEATRAKDESVAALNSANASALKVSDVKGQLNKIVEDATADPELRKAIAAAVSKDVTKFQNDLAVLKSTVNSVLWVNGNVRTGNGTMLGIQSFIGLLSPHFAGQDANWRGVEFKPMAQ